MFLEKKTLLFEVLLPVEGMSVYINPDVRAVESGDAAIVVSLMVGGGVGVNGRILGELLEKYHAVLNVGTVTTSTTTRYQTPGQSLHKKSVRVAPEVWQKWKILAFAHGVSVSLLFAMLMKLEEGGVGEVMREAGIVAVPTFPITLTATTLTPDSFSFNIRYSLANYET